MDREYVEKRAGFEIKAYPGLVDNGTSVSIKLFDQPHIANESHAIGVRRLVLLAIPSPVKYLQEKLGQPKRRILILWTSESID